MHKYMANLMAIRSMPKTTVSQEKNGQFKTTVPKGIAEAMNLDGERIEWKIKSGSTLEVTKIDD